MELLRAASARRLPRLQSALIRQGSWVCNSCRSRSILPVRRLATYTSNPDKPYYVTTPIFYVNAAPHIGHMYSMVLADVLKRWEILKGNRALMLTGTDEHGLKVEQAAAKKDVAPKAFCDETAEQFKELANAANISFDRFIRTTDEDHKLAVEHAWFLLQNKGLIYESKHEGWYSVSDECFYPESQIERRQDPFTGEVFMASTETENKVEWVEEKNYHFRMTALKDRLLEFYKSNPDWVVPHTRMSEVVDWVEKNLSDLSISRPVQRLTWGIRVPDDSSQTIYVWVDALINYITMAGFPGWTPGREYQGGWPADVHVIGKDIVRFHCIYWPALLLALDLPMPKKVLTHAHWTMEGRKMSKSIGNVVNPLYAMNRWGVDTMRFYLMYVGGIAHDADYSNEELNVKYKKYLQGGLGNLLSRLTRSKVWNLRQVVSTADKDVSQITIPEDVRVHMENLEACLRSLPGTVDEQMKKLNPVLGIRNIIEAINLTNVFLAHAAPWSLWKKEDPNDRAVAERSLFLSAEAVRIAGILLQPYLPEKATKLLDIMGVDPGKRSFCDAVLYEDYTYGEPLISPGTTPEDSLFPHLVTDTIQHPSLSNRGRPKKKKVAPF
ncbi:tRNA synthetases class I (M)-domain-containing protein [Podospora fimiseda]|uniref:Probable methionine--tRNA ligase, mitochondrial n=1 Tax=Podospora fimiseda TaxID=252190 RepID=A0AAN7H6K0_9PEZI|nr:tRNA synthetases class I (M)-domain-containing protein [Podospora fimiseda]